MVTHRRGGRKDLYNSALTTRISALLPQFWRDLGAILAPLDALFLGRFVGLRGKRAFEATRVPCEFDVR